MSVWRSEREIIDFAGKMFIGADMLRQLLKSKIHRAMCTMADVEYEGSIEIPADLMEAADIIAGEKVLVTSATAGGRLETYAQPGVAGTGKIIMNGGAAHVIKAGERITIMCFALSDQPIVARKIVCNDQNEIVRLGK